MFCPVRSANARYHVKPRQHRSNVCGDIATLLFSSWWPPPSWILKNQFLDGWYAWETKSAYTCQTLSWLANPLLRYGDFSIIQDGGRPPCWISKSAIFKVQYSPEYPCASPRQIRSKSVKRLRRYGDLTVFQNGGRRHLGFSKIQILNGRYVWEKFPSLC